MSKDTTKAVSNLFLGAAWHDSIEACVRAEIRGFIEFMLESELSTALGRARYARARAPEGLPEASEHRNGHRDRRLMGTSCAVNRRRKLIPRIASPANVTRAVYGLI